MFWNWSPVALLPDCATGKCAPLLLRVVQGPAALASPQSILEMENPRFGESNDFAGKTQFLPSACAFTVLFSFSLAAPGECLRSSSEGSSEIFC